jgi:hypothetical protein
MRGTLKTTKTLNLMLYTFITETGGATLVEQFSAVSIEEALLAWRRKTEGTTCRDTNQLFEDQAPTPVSGLKHVWCYSRIDKKDTFQLIHIVTTKE